MSDLRPENFTELLRLIIRNNPNGSKEEHHDEFRRKTLANAKINLSTVDYAFDNRYPRFSVVQTDPGATVLTEVIAKRKHRQAQDSRIAKKLVDLTKKLDLMHWKMPNGKYLPDCAREELPRDEFFDDLRSGLKPRQTVGSRFSKQDLMNLWMRNSRRAERVG